MQIKRAVTMAIVDVGFSSELEVPSKKLTPLNL